MEEEKVCDTAPEPEKAEKRKPTEKQLEALARGREKRAKKNHEKMTEDNKLLALQKELAFAKEENMKIREEIIKGKLAVIEAENWKLEMVAKKTSKPVETPPPQEPPTSPTIQKPAVVPTKPQKNSTIFSDLCFC